jgi:hypothetical protein
VGAGEVHGASRSVPLLKFALISHQQQKISSRFTLACPPPTPTRTFAARGLLAVVASLIFAIAGACWSCLDKSKERQSDLEQELRTTNVDGQPAPKPKTGKHPLSHPKHFLILAKRSAIPKQTRKTKQKHKKIHVLGSKLIEENWDKKKTLEQKYVSPFPWETDA